MPWTSEADLRQCAREVTVRQGWNSLPYDRSAARVGRQHKSDFAHANKHPTLPT